MNVADFQLRRPNTGVRSNGQVVSAPAGFPTGGDARWTLPVEHLSASSLNMFQVCPRQWQQRYLHNRKETPGQAIVLGQVSHRAIGFNWNCKVSSETDLPTKVVLDYYQDSVWPNTLEEYGGENEIQWDDDQEKVRAQGAKMVSAYHEQVNPRLTPTVVEKEVSFELKDLPVPILGYIDLVQGPGQPCIDLKTSKNRMKKMKSQWRMQGLIYQMAENKAIDWHVLTKQVAPQVVTPLEEPDLAQPLNLFKLGNGVNLIKHLAWTANHYYQTIGPDEDWPTTGIAHDWACSWCGYRKDCPAWRVA